jgi:hypothetical protein
VTGTDRLRRALVASHTPASHVEYKHWWEADSAYRPLEDLPEIIVESGSVTTTRQSNIRTTGTLDLGGWGCLPVSDMSGPVSMQNRYRVRRGVQYPDGTVEDFVLGTFIARRIVPKLSPGGPTVSIDLADEMTQVSYDPLRATFAVTDTAKVSDVLRYLLTDTNGWEQHAGQGLVGWAEYGEDGEVVSSRITPTFHDPRTDMATKTSPAWRTTGPYAVEDVNVTVRTDTDFTGSRLAVVEALGNLANASIYLNNLGQIEVTRSAYDTGSKAWTPAEIIAGGQVAWTFDGADGGSLLDVTHEWSMDDLINQTIVTAADYAATRTVTAGPLTPQALGMFIRYVEDASGEPFSADLTAMSAFASRVAHERLGASRKRSLTGLVIPFLQAGDFIEVANYGEDANQAHTLLVADEVTIPLNGTDTMAVTAATLDVEGFIT